MKLLRPKHYLHHACSLSLALVSLGCGSDAGQKSSVDAGKSDSLGSRKQDGAAGDGDGDGDGDTRTDGDGDLGGDGDQEIDASAPGDGDGATCTNDNHEPDDTTSQSKAKGPVNGIKPVEIKGRTACAEDTDLIWAGPVDNGGKAAAELTWDADDGMLELDLLDADGEPILSFDTTQKEPGSSTLAINEFFGSAPNDDSSDNYFYVRVHNPGKKAVPYSLKVTAQVFGP